MLDSIADSDTTGDIGMRSKLFDRRRVTCNDGPAEDVSEGEAPEPVGGLNCVGELELVKFGVAGRGDVVGEAAG